MNNPVLLLIPSAIILTIASSYAVLLKKTLLENLFLSVTTIVAILFFTGLCNFQGSLLVGYFVILILSLASIIFLIKKRKDLKDIQPQIGIFVFLIFLLGSLFVNYQRYFVQFDELTHWGAVLKNMYHFNALSTYEEIVLIFKTYHPGTTLFQYFWLRPFGEFVEYPGYIGFNMMFFSLAFPLLGKFKFKNIVLFTIFLVAPLLTGLNFYSTLLVDTMLGVLFGALLLYYCLYRERDVTYTFLIVSAISFVLTLTKNTGIGFVLFSLVIIGFNEFTVRKDGSKIPFWKKFNLTKSRKALLFLCPLLAALLGFISWREHVYLQGIEPVWKYSGSNLLNMNLLQYQKETIRLSINALFSKSLDPLGLSYLEIVTLLTVVGGLMVLFNSKRIKKDLFSVLLMWLGSLIYALSLIYFYIFFLVNYESLNLPSFSRYLFPYVIGMLIFLTFFITLIKKDNKRIKLFLSIGLTALLYIYLLANAGPFFYTYILKSRDRVSDTIDLREKYSDIEKWIEYISEEDTVYIISQGDKGYDSLMLRYIISPSNTLFKYDYSVGLDYYHKESTYLNYPFTKIITAETWSKYVIDNYTLLYLFKSDQKFEDIYGSYFDSIEEKTLYKVTTDEEDRLVLKEIK